METATPQQKWSTVHAVVTRADGSKENRGIISFSHRNPIINAVGGRFARVNGWFWERLFRARKFLNI